jgi:hypothetical protein
VTIKRRRKIRQDDFPRQAATARVTSNVIDTRDHATMIMQSAWLMIPLKHAHKLHRCGEQFPENEREREKAFRKLRRAGHRRAPADNSLLSARERLTFLLPVSSNSSNFSVSLSPCETQRVHPPAKSRIITRTANERPPSSGTDIRNSRN